MRFKNKKLHKDNKENLFKNGYSIDDNLFINTYDYDFKKFLNLPLCEFKLKYLEKISKKYDLEYYNYQMNTIIYKDIRYCNLILDDWWRIGFKSKNSIFYLSVSTPELYTINDYEIKNLIRSHYHDMFGYFNEFYIKPKFKKIKSGRYIIESKLQNNSLIKDTKELIDDWLNNNKYSKEYCYYENLLFFHNEKSLSLNNIYITKEKREYNSYNIIVPFNCKLSHLDLFIKFIINDFKLEYKEFNTIKFEKNDYFKNFLIQFKPQLIKRAKRKKYYLKK